MIMEEEKLSFEKRYARLGEIVAKIEGEALPLEETMALYEEGQKLIKSLSEELSLAEEKVKSMLETPLEAK